MGIYEFAMQMEKDGESYYRDLAQKVDNKGIKNILGFLADATVWEPEREAHEWWSRQVGGGTVGERGRARQKEGSPGRAQGCRPAVSLERPPGRRMARPAPSQVRALSAQE